MMLRKMWLGGLNLVLLTKLGRRFEMGRLLFELDGAVSG